MSSILTFSNRSVKLFTLNNRFLITAKVLHSIRMCLTVQVVWQVKHCGCGSCFKMKEWVSLVWPIRNQDITTCSLLDFLDAGLHSPKVGWIWKSLLCMLLLHCCCHFVWRNLLIVGFRSVYGILDLSGVRSKADWAVESALSFPLTAVLTIYWSFAIFFCTLRYHVTHAVQVVVRTRCSWLYSELVHRLIVFCFSAFLIHTLRRRKFWQSLIQKLILYAFKQSHDAVEAS